MDPSGSCWQGFIQTVGMENLHEHTMVTPITDMNICWINAVDKVNSLKKKSMGKVWI